MNVGTLSSLTLSTWPEGATHTAPAPACVDVIERGLDWLTTKLNAFAAQQVSYRRGSAELAVCATFGRTLLKLDDGYGGIRMEWTDRDFLIPAAKLILSGSATLPQRGDVIRETRSGTTFVYEVLAPGSEPAWKWADPFRKMIRIHTKQVGTEVAS